MLVSSMTIIAHNSLCFWSWRCLGCLVLRLPSSALLSVAAARGRTARAQVKGSKGEPLCDSEFTSFILAGLNSDYDSLAEVINERKEPLLLGNVVISKNFLRTRKIMVMHSNERGECCPRTLVDRKRKYYDNAVDVVKRLHDPADPSTEGMAPP